MAAALRSVKRHILLRSGSTLATLTVLTAIGAFLRFCSLGSQSIWHDEAYSLWLAGQPLDSIFANVSGDHVPLYFVLLRWWVQMAGDTEVALRFFSLVFSVASIPLTYLVANRLVGRRIGVLSAAVVTVSPFLVYYAQEVRMYSLVVFLALLSTWMLLQALERSKLYWAGYALAATALVYTHYYGLLLVAGQAAFYAVWLAICAKRSGLRTAFTGALPAALSAAMIVAAFLPWALQRGQVFGSFLSAARSSLSLESVFSKTLIALGTGHSVEALNPSLSDPGYESDHTLAMVLGLALLAVAVIGLLGTLLHRLPSMSNSTGGSSTLSRQLALSLLLLLLVVPLIAAYAVSVGKLDYTARHLISIAPFYYMLVAAGMATAWRRWRPAGAILALLCLCLSGYALLNYYGDPKYARDDWRAAAAYIQSNARQDQAVVCDAEYSNVAAGYYLPPQTPLYGLPVEYPLDEQVTGEALRELLPKFPFVWLALWQDYYSDPDRFVEHWLDSSALLVDEQRFHGGIRVKGYLTAPPLALPAEVPNQMKVNLGGKLDLLGYKLTPAVAGQPWRIALYWRAGDSLPTDYTVFAQLLDATGAKWAQSDSQPVFGSYPTSRWQPGTIVRDERTLEVPSFAPPGHYSLQVGAYDLATMKHLSAPDGSERLRVATVSLQRDPAAKLATAHQTDVNFADILSLRGYDLGDARRGSDLSFTLFWQAISKGDRDYKVFVHLLDPSGALVAQTDSPPAGGIYPTSAWQSGETVRDPRSLLLPATLAPGEYRLLVGLYDPTNGKRLLTKGGWFSSSQDSVTVAKVTVD